MSTLQQAIANIGLVRKQTQMERVWNVVKQDQPCTYTHVAKRTSLAESSVSSILCQMEKRGMVYSRGAKGGGPKGTRKEYLTDQQAYIKMPPVKPKPAERPAPTPVVLTRPAQLTASSLDQMTIAQARDLWHTLNKLFGKK